jgi:Flp pilus assembly pilin Flp
MQFEVPTCKEHPALLKALSTVFSLRLAAVCATGKCIRAVKQKIPIYHPQELGMHKVSINQFKRKQIGQGMMEYIIIVAMIAVAAIGVYAMFGKTIRNQTAGLANEVAGKKADTQISAAATAASTAGTRADTTKGMSEYNKDNDAQ